MVTPFFRDHAVIVTGASSGIGRSLALRLAGQGARVTLAARNITRLETLAQACQQRGGQALVVPTDVSDEAQCRALVERTLHEYGRLDMLINNAGIGLVAKLEELPDLSLFKQVLAHAWLAGPADPPPFLAPRRSPFVRWRPAVRCKAAATFSRPA